MKKELLPDVIKHDFKIVFCGMAVGKTSAKIGGYYAKIGNRFWNMLYELNFTKEKIKSCEYKKILKYNYGLTDLVKNQSGMDLKIVVAQSDINKLREKIKKYQPQILAFNGKEPAKNFLNKKKLKWGKQNDKDKIGKTKIWILPSTSGLNTKWDTDNHKGLWKSLYQEIK